MSLSDKLKKYRKEKSDEKIYNHIVFFQMLHWMIYVRYPHNQ